MLWLPVEDWTSQAILLGKPGAEPKEINAHSSGIKKALGAVKINRSFQRMIKLFGSGIIPQ